MEATRDLGLTSRDGIPHRGCALDLPVEQDGETPLMRGQLGRQLQEGPCPLAVEIEGNTPALLVKEGKGARHVVTGQVGLLLHEKPLHILLPLGGLNLLLDDVSGRQDRVPVVDLRDQGRGVGMHLGEFQLRHALKLLAGRLDLGRIEAGDLDEDAPGSLGGNHRLPDTVGIHTLADHVDGLLQHVGGDFLAVLRDQLKQEGCSSAQIQTEADLLFRRCGRVQAEQQQQDRQRQAEPALFPVTLRGEIPGKETEQEQPEEKGQDRRHGYRGFCAETCVLAW